MHQSFTESLVREVLVGSADAVQDERIFECAQPGVGFEAKWSAVLVIVFRDAQIQFDGKSTKFLLLLDDAASV